MSINWFILSVTTHVDISYWIHIIEYIIYEYILSSTTNRIQHMQIHITEYNICGCILSNTSYADITDANISYRSLTVESIPNISGWFILSSTSYRIQHMRIHHIEYIIYGYIICGYIICRFTLSITTHADISYWIHLIDHIDHNICGYILLDGSSHTDTSHYRVHINEYTICG